MSFRVLVWLSGVRWAVEQCFEETKTELGLAHYEVRKYAGWQHHMLTGMLAHFFLWHLKIRVGEKSASAYGLTSEDLVGVRLTPQNLYPGRGVTVGETHAAAQSPGVFSASETPGGK
jgi:hypothetical protein